MTRMAPDIHRSGLLSCTHPHKLHEPADVGDALKDGWPLAGQVVEQDPRQQHQRDQANYNV